MINIGNAIIATLAMYDIFDYPLTLAEVHEHLINPARLIKIPSGLGDVSLGAVAEELDYFSRVGRIAHHKGFYFLSKNRLHLYETRMSRDRISAEKWYKLLKWSKWFQAVPYLRGMLVSGSLALNNSTDQGDFDVLVIAKTGRLYICRMILLGLTTLLGVRRRPWQDVAPDKFCFNQYLTDASLNIKFESIYAAGIYSNLVPILIKKNIDKTFYSQNLWLNKFIYNFKSDRQFVRRKIKANMLLGLLASWGEIILDTFLGEKLEQWSKQYQQRRIKENPITGQPGGRIIYNEDQLEFHPRTFETMFIDKYNFQLKRLALSGMMENDSGLI